MEIMVATSSLHRAFCANIRAQRIELGLTQAEVAARLNVSQSAYANIERGFRVPGLDIVERVATALGVTPEILLTSREAAVSRG